jgi:hypothetical protein
MTMVFRALAVLTVLLWIDVPATVATSQTRLANPQVEINYVEPKTEEFRPIYERLKALAVLETLREFLSPLTLPRKINITLRECGALMLRYEPNKPVNICYEYVREIEKVQPTSGAASFKELAVVGPFVGLALSQVALAVFDVLDVPIWGNVDDAADSASAIIMLQFGKKVAWTTIVGSSRFLALYGFETTGVGAFSANRVAPREAQRFYNYLCMAYGADREVFGFLVKSDTLPKRRADRCGSEYRQKLRSFKQTVMSHVDLERLQAIRKVDWSTRLHLARPDIPTSQPAGTSQRDGG